MMLLHMNYLMAERKLAQWSLGSLPTGCWSSRVIPVVNLVGGELAAADGAC